MKRILSGLFLLTIASAAYSQNTNNDSPTVTFGVKAGINFSNQSISGINGSSLTGFQFGGVADIGFKNFSIQTGLLYITKGYFDKSDYYLVSNSLTGGTNDTLKTTNLKTILRYVELPVNFVYKMRAGKGFAFLGGGPYVAYAISGALKFDETSSSDRITSSESTGLNFGSGENDDYKRFDFGISLLAGYKLDYALNIAAGYELGISNIAPVSSYQAKNKTFTVSVGYFFK